MSDLILFNFENNDIRFVGSADKPEWIAADICKALELEDVSQALTGLDIDEAGMCIVRIRSENGVEQEREMLTVFESGNWYQRNCTNDRLRCQNSRKSRGEVGAG
jgi:prophage antirepressor-like protein